MHNKIKSGKIYKIVTFLDLIRELRSKSNNNFIYDKCFTGLPVAVQEGRWIHYTSTKNSARIFNELLKVEYGVVWDYRIPESWRLKGYWPPPSGSSPESSTRCSEKNIGGRPGD